MAATHHVLQSSRVVSFYRGTSAVLERSWRSSYAHQVLERIERSRLADWLAHATTHSFLYRWLTKEPEPEVVVIDLRETYTVGPIVAILDRLVDAIVPLWRTSTVKRVTDSLVMLGGTAAETMAGRAIVKLLEPPEPPEEGKK